MTAEPGGPGRPGEGRAGRRQRGQRAGLDRQAVIDAARALAPRAITMQAVADELGVDRKALHHHVRSREALVKMVAADLFTSSFDSARLQQDGDWRQVCTDFARACVDSLVATGELAGCVSLADPLDPVVVRPVEVALDALLAAGFDEECAARGVTALTFLCVGLAQERLRHRRSGQDSGLANLRRALADCDDAAHPTLRRVVEVGHAQGDEAQLAMNLRLFLLGMQQMLDQP
ncbi:TetR/AcrR family transcriptional regulator C-terminal domain-containing protein [Rhodococcus sp. X156]|uniref:TetR/AcrR family transcriptional regulator n=1 Tax=Rhodococcus sp. X156 TaxID=2499145 RepID=UPI000FDC65CA|nr:TetR/AcrR family transcriptional regulator C-terminal domain-containing protein [Rhodococcus sp. X156]